MASRPICTANGLKVRQPGVTEIMSRSLASIFGLSLLIAAGCAPLEKLTKPLEKLTKSGQSKPAQQPSSTATERRSVEATRPAQEPKSPEALSPHKEAEVQASPKVDVQERVVAQPVIRTKPLQPPSPPKIAMPRIPREDDVGARSKDVAIGVDRESRAPDQLAEDFATADADRDGAAKSTLMGNVKAEGVAVRDSGGSEPEQFGSENLEVVQEAATVADEALPAEPIVEQPVERVLTVMALKEWTEPTTGIIFRQIPAGCFYPGSPETENGRSPMEAQGGRVCLNPYWMGSTEVTRGQWERLMHDGRGKQGDMRPVTGVTWQQAQDFVYVLNQKYEGKRVFGLPKELQWEYACRGNTDAGLNEPARYWESVGLSRPCDFETTSWNAGGCAQARTQNGPDKVGSHAANAFGLLDMLGNVSEWTSDSLRPYQRKSGGQMLNVSTNRVVRGGGWSSSKPAEVRCASRLKKRQQDASEFTGFRLVSDEK